MPVGAISAAVGIGSAALKSNAANQAAQAQQQASNQNIGFENQVYGTAGQNLQPFVGYGQSAGNELSGLLGIGGNPQAAQSAFQNYLSSTPYQFMLNQGLAGQSYLNAPNLNSGATAKALGNYAQGMAGQAIFPYIQTLQGQEGLGLNAGSALGQIGTNIAGQEAQARNLAAGATGTADLYGAGAWSSALGGIGNTLSSSLGGFQFPNLWGSSYGGGNTAPGSNVSSPFQQNNALGQIISSGAGG